MKFKIKKWICLLITTVTLCFLVSINVQANDNNKNDLVISLPVGFG